MILDSSCLFHFAWPRVSSGSDGLYLSPLSDMSPATSDCLEPYFPGGGYFIFQLSRVCLKENLNAPRPSLFWFLLFLSDMCTLSG